MAFVHEILKNSSTSAGPATQRTLKVAVQRGVRWQSQHVLIDRAILLYTTEFLECGGLSKLMGRSGGFLEVEWLGN